MERPPASHRPQLEASFPFIGIPELKAVPVRVLSYLRPVPRQFLLELSQDQDLLSELPISVQRQARGTGGGFPRRAQLPPCATVMLAGAVCVPPQVWEVDEGLLERQVMATIEGYQDETATRIRALDMDECLDITAGMGAWAGAAGPRKMPSLVRLCATSLLQGCGPLRDPGERLDFWSHPCQP